MKQTETPAGCETQGRTGVFDDNCTRLAAKRNHLMQETAKVLEALSEERMAPYLSRAGTPEKALALYRWNTMLGAALFEMIQHAEVAARNAMARAFVGHFDSSDWPTRLLNLTRNGSPALHQKTRDDIEDAIDRITRDGAIATPGKVTAELSLGFWRFLTTKRYTDSLWIPALRGAFPSAPERRDVEGSFERMQQLRNRIAHHEPIYTRHLRRDVNAILDIAAWVSEPLERWMLNEQRVHELIGAAPSAAAQLFFEHDTAHIQVTASEGQYVGTIRGAIVGVVRPGRLITAVEDDGTRLLLSLVAANEVARNAWTFSARSIFGPQ